MHDTGAGTAWYRRYGGQGIRVPRYLHRATVRAPSVIPHTAWDHPSRAEACGGSDGVVARERKAPSPFLASPDRRDGPPLSSANTSSLVLEIQILGSRGRPGSVAIVMLSVQYLSPSPLTRAAERHGQLRYLGRQRARPWAWRTLGRGSD